MTLPRKSWILFLSDSLTLLLIGTALASGALGVSLLPLALFLLLFKAPVGVLMLLPLGYTFLAVMAAKRMDEDGLVLAFPCSLFLLLAGTFGKQAPLPYNIVPVVYPAIAFTGALMLAMSIILTVRKDSL